VSGLTETRFNAGWDFASPTGRGGGKIPTRAVFIVSFELVSVRRNV
jgi:hypothetical protein